MVEWSNANSPEEEFLRNCLKAVAQLEFRFFYLEKIHFLIHKYRVTNSPSHSFHKVKIVASRNSYADDRKAKCLNVDT